MPTGYTAKLSDGEQSFEEFVWECARAFGALVLMRDDPADKSVPDKLPVDNFCERELVKTRAELAEWDSSDNVRRLAMYEAEKLANELYAEKDRQKRAATLVRYDAMAGRVQEWKPPSPEHASLREFMLTQLAESRDLDCRPYEPDQPPPFKEWAEAHSKKLYDRIGRYAEWSEKERYRNESRQRWVDQLRASVPQPGKDAPDGEMRVS